MANAKNIDVMRIALQQYAYKESPAGSNNTKYGKAFGMNGQPWCFIFEWWCGEQANGVNPFPHNANAAYGQDEIVTRKGGKWIMEKTASTATKKKGLSKVKYGDCIDFDFGKNNKYRQHTALAVGRSGDYYVCIEGNTSFGESGSQSNGGCVALRFRHYTQVCSIARPDYTVKDFPKPKTPYNGRIPKIPDRGYFKYGDKSVQVGRLQEALKWANGYALASDKVFLSKTFAEVVIFQVANGLKPDGEFGKKSLAKLTELVKNNATQNAPKPPVTGEKPQPSINPHPTHYVPQKGEKCYDLSAWQGAISRSWYEAIKQKGVNCVILRASYTSGNEFVQHKDKYFDHNIQNAIRAGMHIGVYHFSQAKTEGEAKKEADFCLSCIKPYIKNIDLPVAFDWESYKRLSASVMKSNGKIKNTAIAHAFCDRVQKAGYEPMIYASLVVFNNYLTEAIYKSLKIWVAQYYKECQYDHPYYMWQYTSNNGKLDENKFGSQGTKSKEPKKTNAERVMDKAVEYAYPKETPKAKYEVKTGKPKPEYTKALDKIYPKHNSWKKEIRTGASCAVYVATTVKAAGADSNFICDNPPKQYDYMLRSDKWSKVNDGKKPVPKDKLKPGDIIVYEKPGAHGDGHILFYKGNGYQVEANYNRCYPHTSKLMKAYTNETYIKNTFKRFGVFRRKG